MSSIRRIMLFTIQLIEIPLVVVVSLMAVFTEDLDPAYLRVGLALLAVPMLLRLLLTGRIVQSTMTLWPLLLLLALCGGTMFVTPSWQHTWPELVRLLAGMALCLAMINWINPIGSPNQGGARGVNLKDVQGGQNILPDRVPWRAVIGTIAFVGLAVGLAAVGMLALGPTNKFLSVFPALSFPGTDWGSQLARTGTFNPNRVAGVAVWALPLTLTLLLGPLLPRQRDLVSWVGWSLTKALALMLSTMLLLVVILTQSRGALLAFGCATVVTLLYLGRRGWIILALLLFIGVGAFIELRPGNLKELLIVRATDPAVGNTTLENFLLEDRNFAGRLVLWQRALHGIADAPLTGMGLGAFEAISQQPYPALPGFKPDPDMSHVHNIVLQVGVDFGVPGIIAFLLLLVIMALLLLNLLRHTPPHSPYRTWSVGLCGTFVAYLVYNMFDALTLGARPAMIVWCLFGLWIGAGEAMAQQLAPQQAVPPRPASHPSVRSTPPLAGENLALEQKRTLSADEAWAARAWAVTEGDNHVD